MRLWKEYKKLWGTNPLNAGILTLSLAYAGDKVRKAITADSGDFYGIGASTSTTSSTSASHAMMNRGTSGDLMDHPASLFGYKNMGSHCTGGVHGACTNPHCITHGGMGSVSVTTSTSSVHPPALRESYGDDSHTSPSQLFGVSSSARRRVMVNNQDYEGYNRPQAGHLFGHKEQPSMSDSDLEMIADMGGF